MMAAGPCGCTMSSSTPAPTDGAPPAPTPCMAMGGGGGFGGGQCSLNWSETCSGTSYKVSCSCPEGACVCFGPTTHVVHYSGCPYCPAIPSVGPTSVADVFTLCGFPPYPQ
jgi:hypothetical protein